MGGKNPGYLGKRKKETCGDAEGRGRYAGVTGKAHPLEKKMIPSGGPKSNEQRNLKGAAKGGMRIGKFSKKKPGGKNSRGRYKSNRSRKRNPLLKKRRVASREKGPTKAYGISHQVICKSVSGIPKGFCMQRFE